jgi:hypothetical protein
MGRVIRMTWFSCPSVRIQGRECGSDLGVAKWAEGRDSNHSGIRALAL